MKPKIRNKGKDIKETQSLSFLSSLVLYYFLACLDLYLKCSDCWAEPATAGGQRGEGAAERGQLSEVLITRGNNYQR